MTAPSNSGPLRVPCPHCQAPAGTPCSSRSGRKADTHQDRWLCAAFTTRWRR